MNIYTKFLNDLNFLIDKNTFNEELAQKLLNKETTIKKCISNLGLIIDKFTIETLEYLTEKNIKLNNHIILNHTTFKLSDLDQEMICTIPQGGNWKHIKQEVINKSQRLMTIQKTGGRTTLYGRLDYLKPSYTITTYFNRPGNGTYVHPIHNRVISVREAARLQSFPDNYYFTGNKSDILKQVGNAVPPLLAFSIAKQIKKHISINTSIDLFCGAGGMTSGLAKSGIKSLLGLDFNRSACITFKVNNPESKVLWEDITKSDVKDSIVQLGKTSQVDLVCGGPPCQGFSHAGKRFIDDPRNQLFKDYIEVVSKINPKVVIMENVHGMLTMDNGRVYKEVLDLFNNMGYEVEGRLLLASEYGVPQKRKRLIFIAVRKDLNITPNILFPEKFTLDKPISTKDAIYDLEDITCAENTIYTPNDNELSSYVRDLRS